MSSKINLQTCEYARKSSIFQDNQLIYLKLEKTIQYFLHLKRPCGKPQSLFCTLFSYRKSNISCTIQHLLSQPPQPQFELFPQQQKRRIMIIIQQLSIPFSQPQPQLPKLPNPFSPQPQNNKIKIIQRQELLLKFIN